MKELRYVLLICLVLISLLAAQPPTSSSAQTAVGAAVDAAFVRENYSKYEYRIPMRDGVKLFTSIYVPKDVITEGKTYPILLQRTPYNVAPYAGAALDRTDVRAAHRAFWDPAVTFLRDKSMPNYRVEVVPTFDHWEAYWLPRAGIPLARGWYRQIDIARNELFYEKPLGPAAYRQWLRGMGVRFVVLPETRLGQKGEEREARLLRSGRSGLRPALRRRRPYRLPPRLRLGGWCRFACGSPS